MPTRPKHLHIPVFLLTVAHVGLVAAQLGFSVGSTLAWPLVKRAIRQRHPSVNRLSTEELATWLAKPDTVQPLLLDVRTSEEFQISHLRKALLAPAIEEAMSHLAEAPSDTPIVAYCSVGYRSSDLAGQLQSRGFTQVFNLEGSIFQWANEGRPIYRGEEKVGTVHPYGGLWKQLLKPELREKRAQ